MNKKVREFHEALGLPLDQDISFPGNYLTFVLRRKLLIEEMDEVMDAVDDLSDNLDTPHIHAAALLKEFADLVYVIVGFCETFGYDFDEAFARVHQSNMSKLDDDGKPVRRSDGKVLKGPNYLPPILLDLTA